jgi:hypothetical protein
VDFLFIAVAVCFFAASWWFVRACASLEQAGGEKK